MINQTKRANIFCFLFCLKFRWLECHECFEWVFFFNFFLFLFFLSIHLHHDCSQINLNLSLRFKFTLVFLEPKIYLSFHNKAWNLIVENGTKRSLMFQSVDFMFLFLYFCSFAHAVFLCLCLGSFTFYPFFFFCRVQVVKALFKILVYLSSVIKNFILLNCMRKWMKVKN